MVSAGMAQRLKKPKTHKGKKVLEDREPKLIENDKKTLFIRGARVSNIVNEFLHDLYKLKQENSIFMQRNNPFLLFNDDTGVEKFSQKHDASLFLFGSHQKKRPHNVICGRMFDYHVLDMIEIGLQNYRSISSFQTEKCALNTKPCLVFHGDLFQSDPVFKRFKNLLIDMFRGPVVENIRLQGTELTLCFTAVEGKVLFRTYRIFLKKSETKLPRVEILEMGPCADLMLRRTKLASDDLFKLSCKQPKELKVAKVKNISHDVFGTELARIHVGKQDLGKLQTRKLRALKNTQRATENTEDNVSNSQEPVSSKKKRTRTVSASGVPELSQNEPSVKNRK